MKSGKCLSVLIAALLVLYYAFNVQANEKAELMMATTTSTDNTGLLDYLIPFFEQETGIALKWTATGTGNALKLGQKREHSNISGTI